MVGEGPVGLSHQRLVPRLEGREDPACQQPFLPQQLLERVEAIQEETMVELAALEAMDTATPVTSTAQPVARPEEMEAAALRVEEAGEVCT